VPPEYKARLTFGARRASLHESGTYVKFTQAGAELFVGLQPYPGTSVSADTYHDEPGGHKEGACDGEARFKPRQLCPIAHVRL